MGERDLVRLEQALARAPRDSGVRLELARETLRVGSRALTLALVNQGLELGAGEALGALENLREEILGAVRPLGKLSPESLPEASDPRRRSVMALAFDDAERRLAIARGQGRVAVVGLGAGPGPGISGSVLWEVQAHRRATTAVTFSPGDGVLATAGGDGVARIWDLETRQAVRRMEGARSRAVRIGLWRERFEVTWRDFRLQGTREDPGVPTGWSGYSAFPGLLLPGASGTRLADLEQRIFGLLRERLPRLQGMRLEKPGAWSSQLYLPCEDPEVALVSNGPGTALALVYPGQVMILDGRGEVLVELSDPGLKAPLGLVQNLAPAMAVDPTGRVVILGSSPRGRGASLVEPGSGRIVRLLERERISAVTISPSGDLAALGTFSGEVYLLPLVDSPRGRRSVGAPAHQEQEVPVGSGEDLSEKEGTERALPVEFRLLARFSPRDLPLRVTDVKLEAEELWLYPGRNRDRRRATLQYLELGRYPLRERAFQRYPYALDEAGVPRTWEARARWIFLTEFVIQAAPPGTPTPGLPEEPLTNSEVSFRREVEEAVGATTRGWVRAAPGGIHAFRVVQRPREFWLVHPDEPGEPRRFPTEDTVAKLAFSPRGSRLAVLLRKGQVLLYGVWTSAS